MVRPGRPQVFAGKVAVAMLWASSPHLSKMTQCNARDTVAGGVREADPFAFRGARPGEPVAVAQKEKAGAQRWLNPGLPWITLGRCQLPPKRAFTRTPYIRGWPR